MPYIIQDARDIFDDIIAEAGDYISSAGELNYVLTRLVFRYLNRAGPTPNYAAFNEVIGVLECAKLELYRRLVAPYEDKKCLENGDVFGYNEETESHD